ncbi:hypothetical protein PV326_011829 [Microctonus aethiopoides]|nr:hypothetical protein PV326_011829 [Microctonus aethiopoides]
MGCLIRPDGSYTRTTTETLDLPIKEHFPWHKKPGPTQKTTKATGGNYQPHGTGPRWYTFSSPTERNEHNLRATYEDTQGSCSTEICIDDIEQVQNCVHTQTWQEQTRQAKLLQIHQSLLLCPKDVGEADG